MAAKRRVLNHLLPEPAMVRKQSAVLVWCVVLLGSLSACTEIRESVCADKVRSHFAAFESSYAQFKPQSIEQVRTMASNLSTVVATAPAQGCGSQVQMSLAELQATATDLQSALSDESLMVAGVMSLFGAGEASPMMKKVEAATGRYDRAMAVLREASR
jgi:hypothetical protein